MTEPAHPEEEKVTHGDLVERLEWKCACGWHGDITKAPSNPSGGRVCPNCGASGGLESDRALSHEEGKGK